MADLACVIADGGEAISDFRVMTDKGAVFGLVASVPTAWRTLAEVAGSGKRTLGRIVVRCERNEGHQRGSGGSWLADRVGRGRNGRC
jgi:hypothetical protein